LAGRNFIDDLVSGMIVTTNLSKKFDDFLAVDRINLTIPPGQVLALLGPNGAGKTTTVRMLTSVLRPSTGSAQVAGYDVVQQSAQVRAHVGVLTEMHGLYDRMPADDYLDFFGQLYSLEPAHRARRIKRLLEQFGLEEDAQRRIGEYSKGMRQKLALARALLHEPPVLLLDEPTSAMDPQSARLVRDAILDLRTAERTIIICTHNLAEAEELADQIAIIRRGRIIASGTPDALKQALLGPVEYEVRLATQLNGNMPVLPSGVKLTSFGENWLRYTTAVPQAQNPKVLRILIEGGLEVTDLFEVSRSLEQVYLQVVSNGYEKPDQEIVDVG
jgi:ABC-2 type transport system ATP-binding protein